MNPRIRELALQAGFGEQWFEEHPTGCSLPKPLMLKEYTELIIKECTQLLFAESERLFSYAAECENMRHSDEADTAAEKCMDNILMIEQHFGVE